MKKIIVYLMHMSVFLMPIQTYAQESYEFQGERINRLYHMGEVYQSDDFHLASLPDESVEKLANEDTIFVEQDSQYVPPLQLNANADQNSITVQAPSNGYEKRRS